MQSFYVRAINIDMWQLFLVMFYDSMKLVCDHTEILNYNKSEVDFWLLKIAFLDQGIPMMALRLETTKNNNWLN